MKSVDIPGNYDHIFNTKDSIEQLRSALLLAFPKVDTKVKAIIEGFGSIETRQINHDLP